VKKKVVKILLPEPRQGSSTWKKKEKTKSGGGRKSEKDKQGGLRGLEKMWGGGSKGTGLMVSDETR